MPPAKYCHKRLLQQLSDQAVLSLPYHGRVVDLGCGSAPYKQHILKTAAEYIGLDWQNTQHDQTQVDIVADLTQPLPLSSEYADIVTAFQVLEHLPEPSSFLAECHRILKPNGKLYLTTPFMHKIHEAPHDYYRFTPHGLEYLLNKNGFTNIQTKPYTGFWQMMTTKFNYWSAQCTPRWCRFFWYVVWAINQPLATWLDRFTHYPDETSAYLTTAQKA